MPVDYFVCFLPLVIFVAAIFALLGGGYRKLWLWITGGLLSLFILIYFVPGWILLFSAQGGDREAQYQLGNYYWSRLGNNLPNLVARDKWWLKAAKNGHPHAMYRVGYFSIFGSSMYIPRDLVAARDWLESAKKSGSPEAIWALRVLAKEEAK